EDALKQMQPSENMAKDQKNIANQLANLQNAFKKMELPSQSSSSQTDPKNQDPKNQDPKNQDPKNQSSSDPTKQSEEQMQKAKEAMDQALDEFLKPNVPKASENQKE